MAKQLKLFITYRCNVYDENGKFIKTLWETLNKQFAEEFISSWKITGQEDVRIDEITEDEI